MFNRIIVLGGGSAGYMAALALKVKIPDLRVTVIRSKELGIIGVGEGSSIPLTNFLHGYLLLTPKKFFELARPTWKLGIRFIWGPRPGYYYPFGAHLNSKHPFLHRNNGFYAEQDMEYSNLETAFMAHDKVFQRGPDGQPLLHWNVAYHLENEKFVQFLETFAGRVGVETMDDTVDQVTQNESGVSGLALKSGRTESADLYVDCSGFRSLLLGQTLGEPFISFKSSLFCDRAVAGGWDRTTEPIHPYTTSEQMDCGWAWQIEHERRINRGYVYSSDFISDEQAEAEFRARNPKVGPTRVVKFVSGRYQREWVKNVVAIGNASGFVEPLEATALAVIATRSQLLSQILVECGRREVPAVQVDLYNQHHARLWDCVRRFLAIHYKCIYGGRTEFWRACENDTDLAGAEPLLEYYQRFGPSGLWGPMLLDPIDPFGMGGYLNILVGQKVPHQQPHVPGPQELSVWNAERQKFRAAALQAMTVAEALSAIHSPETRRTG